MKSRDVFRFRVDQKPGNIFPARPDPDDIPSEELSKVVNAQINEASRKYNVDLSQSPTYLLPDLLDPVRSRAKINIY